ncbi:molybdopterin molybdotransferase MoeA [Microbacterium sp.]|uniref:molybdopterin molybdotransferase MoeA n=1 Tax=Microbacterium sp. TaxID=51671 RepID=UPI003F9B9788
MSVRTPADHALEIAELLRPLRTRLCDPRHADRVPLSEALGRLLAEDVASPGSVPPFANSQMDGYAVRSADVHAASAVSPVTLPVGATSAAGDPIRTHVPGTASPVMTGAPIPNGADAVIPIELADPPHFAGIGADRRDAEPGTTVSFAAPVNAGTFVRPAGADLARGAVILRTATRLGPVGLGSLAAAGVAEVPVRPRPRVLLLSTGDELRAPGEPLAPGQIHDANTTSLTAALRESGAVVVHASVPDAASAVLEEIARHPDIDVVVTAGGVSAGAFEVVRDALEDAGVTFEPIAMQPGGPQGFGAVRSESGRSIPIVAFPGNPVSALLSFEMFLRPLLRELVGLAPMREITHAPLAHAITSPRAKHQVRRGTLRADGTVEVGAPGSHLLHDYARATVLAHIPIGVDALAEGAEVEIWRIDD